ncbi:MAG: hypothetical protein D5R98_07165 [Desulfonatronovibrio sp. MSAO_Bac4]|nr:MAG: hypothetical protein D5R98_07165 [Desulfonatronovibrio sp. MSAO_Bac4]
MKTGLVQNRACFLQALKNLIRNKFVTIQYLGSLCPIWFSFAANSRRKPVSQNHYVFHLSGDCVSAMLLANGLKAGQTRNNPETKQARGFIQ